MSEPPPEPFDTVGDEHVEARIVAWVLGESSAFEAAELERLCGERPELEIFRRRIQEIHGLVREAAASEADKSWKLPPEKRWVLDAKFGAEIPPVFVAKPDRERHIRRSSRRALWGIAACLVLTVVVIQMVYPIWVRQGPFPAPEKQVSFMPASGGGAGVVMSSSEFAAAPQSEEPTFRMESKSLSDRKMDMKQKASQSQLARRAPAKSERVFAEGAQSIVALPESAPALPDAENVPMQGARGGLAAGSGGFALRSADGSGKRNHADAIPADGREVSAPARPQDAAAMPTLTARDAATRQPGALGLQDPLAGPAAARADMEADSPAKDMPSFAGKLMKAPTQLGPPAAPPVLDDLAQREMISRQDAVVKGDKLLENGRDAYSKGDYQKAARQYDQALKELPDSPALADRRKSYAGHLADANVAQAMQNRKVGKYKEAEELLNKAVTLDPNNEAAKRELGHLDDPIRTNGALTYEHTANVDKVRRGLYAGEGNMNLGRYDDAKKSYEEVLKTDPYNAAARRGLEKVEAAKSDYYRAAYDQTRAELLSQVDSNTELSVPDDTAEAAEAPVAPADEKARDAEPVLEPETSAAENPYSTFSLHVSDASFQLAKAAMDKGGRPEPAEVKVEQFYNAVDYGDPAPGADQPVAATIEQCAHPVVPGRNLVRVALRTASAGRGAAQALRLTLLVDQSGSMVREDRRAAMARALGQLGGLLTENDRVTIVGFSRTPRLLAEDLSGADGKKLETIINQASSEGGTNLEEAMKLGAQLAERHQLAGAQNRIVLFTDGAANLGNADPDKLEEQVKSLRQKGISFDIAGIGTDGLNDRLLAQLARHGNGRYYVVGADQKDDLARQLAGAFRPAAENVKVQVIFNPQRVGNYKLIGFKQDLLKTEDFRNDSVDAAELAADEAGVALYQVQPLAGGSGEIGEVSVRFRDVASGEMVERSWTIPYEESASAFDRASPSMQLAGLAMMAGEKLRGGEMAGAIEFKKFAGSVAEVRTYYGKSERVGEMLGMVEKLK